jgi:hypothetical protein
LTTDGLLDGRDVAADGTKLDGIESGATADQTAAEIKTAYESNANTNAFTDSDESKLDGIEASADVTDTANVTAAGALMDSELTSEASVKALNQGVATTDSPTFAGVTAPVTGNVTGNLTGNVTGNVTGDLTGDVTGNVTGNLTGSVLTAAQTNITSVGTLGSLTVSGDVTVDTNSLKVDSTNNRVGILNASPDVTLDVGSATDAVHVPTGTTAQRPTGAAGYFRYNSTLEQFEGYTDAWGAIGGGGGSNLVSDTMTGDGVDTTLTLSNDPLNENNTQVYIDGVYQNKDTYSVSGTTLTFSTAPPSGSAVEAMTIQPTAVNVPADASVTPAKIASGDFYFDTDTLHVDATNNRVGIGTVSPKTTLNLAANNSGQGAVLTLENTDTSITTNDVVGQIDFYANDGSTGGTGQKATIQAIAENSSGTSVGLIFGTSPFPNTAATERARLSAGGVLLVGKTGANNGVAGVEASAASGFNATVSGDTVSRLNRLSSDGEILRFQKDTTTVGSISSRGGEFIAVGSGDTFLEFNFGSDQINPSTGSASRDNAIDLGSSGARFDDIYATNGTIQTSDRNEKQDIEALSDAEQRVAVAAKSLLRKFRWINSVETKGDEARIHFGIIAQDLQAAFEAEGLDAGRYAMFMSNTWTDEETGEERTRLGVRYSELLAFIISAI